MAKMTRLEQFFDDLGNKSKSTISGYNTAIRQYMKFIYPDSTKEEYSDCVDRYFSESRNYHDDFKKFIQKTQGDKPALSALQTFNQIHNFLKMCDVIFSTKEIHQVKNQLPKGGVMSMEDDLDTETIRNLIQHTDIKGKSLILCLATGGMRIGELLQIRCEDVDLNSIPAMLKIRPKTATGKTKNGEGRTTFISSEATAAVREWAKVRGEYLTSVSNKGYGLKNRQTRKDTDDDRLFPFSDNTVNELFRDAVIAVFGKNAVDPNTNRSTRHIHQLRKFFISQLSLAISKEIAETLAGHSGYLTGNYRRYTTAQLKDEYLKGEHMLYIEAVKEIRESATTAKTEILAMKDAQNATTAQMNSLLFDKGKLGEKVRMQSEQITEMSSQIAKMTEVLGKIIQNNITEDGLEVKGFEISKKIETQSYGETTDPMEEMRERMRQMEAELNELKKKSTKKPIVPPSELKNITIK
jgi:integrase